MKKLSKITKYIAITALLFACDKEYLNQESDQTETTELTENSVIDQNRYSGIAVQDGVLSYSSIEYYESIVSDESENFGVDELTDYLNSTSFKSYGKKFGEESEYNEPFMDAIMNEDKVVKIGEWFIYINIPSETVLAISENEENAYSSLLDLSNKNIHEFNIGDDVLDHLSNGTTPQDRGCGGIGGGTYVSAPLTIGSWFTEAYVDFFRAGVYFRLKAGAAPSSSGVYNQTIEVLGPQAWRMRRPCNGRSKGTSPSGSKLTTSGSGVWAFYTNVRNLNGYYLFARLRVATTSGNVYTTWAGRNINSPY